MADETGFFRFDTNIDGVVSDIEGGFRRLNSALSKPLRLNAADLGVNSQELQTTFARLESQLVQGQQRIRELFSQRRAGLIDSKAFDREVRGAIMGSLGSIPTMLADGLAKVPKSVAATTPAKLYATTLAQDFVSTLGAELDRGLANAGGKVRSVDRFQSLLGEMVPRIEANPLGLGTKTTSDLAYYSARVRAEQLIKENLSYESTIRTKADAMGLGPMVTQILDVEGRRYETETGGGLPVLRAPRRPRCSAHAWPRSRRPWPARGCR